MYQKRTSQRKETPEAKALKGLREAQGLSMREVASYLGKSDSYISHIETGRLDFPQGEILKRLLGVYEVSSIEDFREKVNHHKKVEIRKEELSFVIKKMSDEKVEILSQFLSLLLDQRKEELCFKFFQSLR